jgi:prevent-host-death family protein
MVRTTAVEFQKKVGEFQHRARNEPVEITRHGRREFVLMSAERYDWLMAAAKRVNRTEDLPETIIDALRRAEMDPRHNHLNKLMK